MSGGDGFVRHPLLSDRGIEHGFGTRHAHPPEGVVQPRQVHGARVVVVERGAAPEADAVATTQPGTAVGVITADCVPVLAVAGSGSGAVAIHAGWRGLAKGVVEAGIGALDRLAGGVSDARAVIGPCIGACCYEVDAPVLAALRERFGDDLDAGLAPSRPGHAMVDLGRLVSVALERSGLSRENWARVEGACTRCDSERFHSFRRDGPRAGRLVHYVAAARQA